MESIILIDISKTKKKTNNNIKHKFKKIVVKPI